MTVNEVTSPQNTFIVLEFIKTLDRLVEFTRDEDKEGFLDHNELNEYWQRKRLFNE